MINGLGERLQKQRFLLHLSQKEVAIAIGISPSIVSNYESGERTPSVENLMSLANLYHCTTDYLLGLTRENDILLNTDMLSEKQCELLQSFLNSINNS